MGSYSLISPILSSNSFYFSLVLLSFTSLYFSSSRYSLSSFVSFFGVSSLSCSWSCSFSGFSDSLGLSPYFQSYHSLYRYHEKGSTVFSSFFFECIPSAANADPTERITGSIPPRTAAAKKLPLTITIKAKQTNMFDNFIFI